MKKYPLGIQTFSEIVAGNYIYMQTRQSLFTNWRIMPNFIF